MSKKRSGARAQRPPCGSFHADDGIDPRTFFKERKRFKPSRKDLQLCGQVARVLNLALAIEPQELAVGELYVECVEPALDATRLIVTVRAEHVHGAAGQRSLLARLERIKGRLRTEVAAGIHRKRAPEISFHVL